MTMNKPDNEMELTISAILTGLSAVLVGAGIGLFFLKIQPNMKEVIVTETTPSVLGGTTTVTTDTITSTPVSSYGKRIKKL